MEEQIYEIFTDASFDDVTKLGTYSIVIIQDQKILNAIAKKCNVQLESSTECEVFAIFQAINFIQGSLLKNKVAQKFWLRTDCVVARDFFLEKNTEIKIFKQNLDLLNTIKKSFECIRKRLTRKDCSFRLRWVPRGSNKIAHKYSYSAFQKFKLSNSKNDLLLIDKKSFFELLQRFNSKQYEVIVYLFQVSNERKLIIKTQREIAQSLNISIYSINKIFKELIKINILGKVQNGKYTLLI